MMQDTGKATVPLTKGDTPYVPPELVKPEDIVDPRIGPEYQVTDIPEAVPYVSTLTAAETTRSSSSSSSLSSTIPSYSSSSSIVSFADRMVCLHKAALSTTDTLHQPTDYDILLDDFGLIYLDKQKQRSSKRTATATGRPFRSPGPGSELLLTVLRGTKNDTHATKQALPLIIAYIESTTEENRVQNWNILLEQGRGYHRPSEFSLSSSSSSSFSSSSSSSSLSSSTVHSSTVRSDDRMDIENGYSSDRYKPLLSSTVPSSHPLTDIASNRSSPLHSDSPLNSSLDASIQPRYTVTTYYLTEAFRAARAFLAASGYDRWTDEDVREHASIEHIFSTVASASSRILPSSPSVSSASSSSSLSSPPHLQASTLSTFLQTIPFHSPPTNYHHCYYEKPWTDNEHLLFTEALNRHNKAFTIVARSIPNRSAQECVNYYYHLWRFTKEYEDYKKRKDRLGKFGRFDVELRRRDRAWLHYWRFDDEALGPPLPPAQAYVPDALRFVTNETTTKTVGSIQFTASNGSTVTMPSPTVPAGVTYKDTFALPLLAPALPVVVTAEGIPLPAPKPKSKDSSTVVSSNGAAVTTYLSSTPFPATGSSSHSMVLDPSDPQSLVVPRTKWENMTATQLQTEQERLARNLRETQFIDPLNDYARVLRAAGSALKLAALEAGYDIPSDAVRSMSSTLSTGNENETSQPLTTSSATNLQSHPHPSRTFEPYPKSIVTTYAHSDLVSAAYPTPHHHHSTPPDTMTLQHLQEAQQAIALANRSHIIGDPYIEERFIDNESFCGICGDGGDMICCDGPCRRSFHKACLHSHDNGIRAAIKVSPALQLHRWYGNLFNYERDDWCCYACISGIHECFICGNSGHDGFDIFRCQRMCGKWYHLACLAKWPATKFYPTNLHGVYINPVDNRDTLTIATPAPVRGTNAKDRIECTAEIMQETMRIEEAGKAAIEQNGSSLLSTPVPKGRTSRNSTKTPLDISTVSAVAKAHVALKIQDIETPDKDIVSLVEEEQSASTSLTSQNFIGNVQIPPGTSPRFSCPLHVCVACNQEFHSLVPTLYMRCHACPSTYHVSCVPKDAQKDMNEILTCSNTTAHDAKKMTPLYRQRSGVSRIRPLEEAVSEEVAAARRRDALVQTSATKSNRMGDAFMLRLRTTTSDDAALSDTGKRIGTIFEEDGDVSMITGASTNGGTRSKKGTADDTVAKGNNKLVLRVPGATTAPVRSVSPTVALPTGTAPPAKKGFTLPTLNPSLAPSIVLPAERTSTVTSPRSVGARLSHIEAFDEAFRDEILRRTAYILQNPNPTPSAINPPRRHVYYGVAEVERGKVFSSRIEFRQHRMMEVGRFEDPRAAAVAYDYASTFYRLGVVLNFPDSVSDCRIRPPIDPLPPRVECPPEEKKWAPLPGEETVPVYFREKPDFVIFPDDQIRVKVEPLSIASMDAQNLPNGFGSSKEQIYTVNSIDDIYSSRTRDEFERFVGSGRSASSKTAETASLVSPPEGGVILGKRQWPTSNNPKLPPVRRDIAHTKVEVSDIQLWEEGPFSTYLGVYASQSLKPNKERWLAKFRNRLSTFDNQIDAAVKYDSYLIAAFAKGEITFETLQKGTNFAIDPVIPANNSSDNLNVTDTATFVTRKPLVRSRLVLYNENSVPIIVELGSTSYFAIPTDKEEILYPVLLHYRIVGADMVPYAHRLRGKLVDSNFLTRTVNSTEMEAIAKGKVHRPIPLPYVSDWGPWTDPETSTSYSSTTLSSSSSSSSLSSSTVPRPTTTKPLSNAVSVSSARTAPSNVARLGTTASDANNSKYERFQQIFNHYEGVITLPIYTTSNGSSYVPSSGYKRRAPPVPADILPLSELTQLSNSDLYRYATKLSSLHPELNDSLQAFERTNKDTQTLALPASTTVPLDVDAATRAAADEWRRATPTRHGELENEVANLTGIKSELLYHLWRITPQWEAARPQDAVNSRTWLRSKCILHREFIEMRNRARKPLPKILTVYDILPYDPAFSSGTNGSGHSSSSSSSSPSASSSTSSSSSAGTVGSLYSPDKPEIIDGRLNPDARTISRDTSNYQTLVIYNNDGLYVELDGVTLQPHTPFHFNHNVVYESLGTMFFDETFEPLDVPVGLKISIIHTSYLQPALRCVYVVESLLRSIQPNSSTYAKYVEIRNNEVARRARDRLPNHPRPYNYPYPKAISMNRHVNPGEPVAIRAWGLRMRNPIDNSNVGFEGLSLSQVWLTTAQAINLAQTTVQRRYQSLQSETLAQFNVVRDRLIKIIDTINTQRLQKYNDELTRAKLESAKTMGTPTAPYPPLSDSEKRTLTIRNYIQLSRTDINRFGLPPITPVTITSKLDRTVLSYGICRHEKCVHTPLSREGCFGIVPVYDETTGEITGPGYPRGRYMSRLTHLWRHELVASKHEDCNKSECVMCIYINTYLTEFQDARLWPRTRPQGVIAPLQRDGNASDYNGTSSSTALGRSLTNGEGDEEDGNETGDDLLDDDDGMDAEEDMEE